jgi:sporulation protein YlmC with PRC-barrel domain
MKIRYTTLATGVLLALAVGIPAQALAAEHGAEKQQGEPGTYGSGMTQRSAQQGQQQGQMTRNMSVTDLEGKAVINAANEEIGEIEQIVRNKTGDRVSAVVSVGGFLGIGDKHVTIPLDEMYLEGERLRSPLASTETELKNRDAYNEDMHERIDAEQTVPVSEFAAFEVQEPPASDALNPGARPSGMQSPMEDSGRM